MIFKDMEFKNFNEIDKTDLLPFPQFKSQREKIPLIVISKYF